MIVKRNFNPLKVVQYVRCEMAFATVTTVAVFVLQTYSVANIALPFSIAAIMGSALAIFMAFRNNSSYARWWEARTLWSGITNSSRILARLIITFADSHSHQQNYDRHRSSAFKKDMVYKVIAWVHALRLHLRNQSNWQELKPFLSEQEYAVLEEKQHKPNHLQMVIGNTIYEAMAHGTLGGFDSFQMEGQLLALANYQGGCERIKNTPLLRHYDYFTRVFLYAFMLLLPFSLMRDFSTMNIPYLMIPVSVTISFVFAILGKVGEVNEDPFENRITDVPLTAISTTIERDLREMLGEKDLPPPVEPEQGFIF